MIIAQDDSLELIYRDLMDRLVHHPEYESAPRGKAIREGIGAHFVLTDPRNRLILSPARAVNYGFAVGELCWYLRGATDLETMLYYNRRMGQFSDDGRTINSAYGAKLFNGTEVVDGQWDFCVRELAKDPDSRRAVMHINQPSDLRRAVAFGSKDVPCTMSIQLLIRNRRLHMHVLMRSNDLVWGVPYDVFSFTCLQEAFLYSLRAAGVPVDDLGHYHHTAGSLHIYDTHYGMAEEVSKEAGGGPPPMSPFTLDGLQVLAEDWEPRIRRGEELGYAQDWYGETVEWMATRLEVHRRKRDGEEAERVRREAALAELTRLTEDAVGSKDENVKQA